MERDRRPGQRCPNTHTTRTTSHLNVRYTHSSCRSIHRPTSSHFLKHEDSTDMDSRINEYLEEATDREG